MKLHRKNVKANLRQSSLWISLISLTLITSGCHEDLSQVREFSKVSGTIQETSEKLGKDIYESCLRRENRLDETEKLQSSFAQTQFPSPSGVLTRENSRTRTLEGFEEFPVTGDSNPYKFPPIRMDERCDRFKPVAKSTIQANLLAVNYLESLGQLAGDQRVSLNQSLTDIGSAITNLNSIFGKAKISVQINSDYVKAGENIVGFLLDNFVVKPIQRKNLKSVIVCQDKNFQQYILLLNEVNQLYRDTWLEGEKGGLYRYFEERFQQAPTRYRNNMPEFANEIQTITQQYTQEKAQLNGRKEQAETYIALLSLTAQNHHELAVIFGNNMDKKAIQSFCPQNSTATTDEIYQNLEPPSQEQLKEAQKVLDNYLKEAKPLVAKLNQKAP
ncbi:MAG: hypothetical protein EWV92_15510 [Microcystis aeruginosa Ma_MB_S_20031200_S102]|uniref:Uncharacterized protein n=1 Tax=Microcystis aeruginosa Ma_MB_S_20031200_S102 TaxID=2486254 RepID=A0A552EIR5_MICAE|nr:MAG: hypothetical protein EWV79_14185 [Microcystis aeruginosa Ma_MB_S_20031200_S102D]TRU34389.1 MAG: hypothetical protein EWV92_15510 [Microcystis aeruginosa Ma_MB_S_20031200_S102]